MVTIRNKIALTLLLAICSAASAWADTYFVFKGTIGNYPIVMGFWATLTCATGDYYYVSQGKNKKIKLEGQMDLECEEDNVWHFDEEINGKWNGMFRLKWDRSTDAYRNKYVEGMYVNAKGKRYPVRLTRVDMISNPDHI